MGWIYPSLTLFAVFPTVVVNHPKPFVKAATGSLCRSSRPGNLALLPSLSIGWLPNPAYFPPCEGGKSSDLFAFAAPRPAKYLSSTFTFPLEGLEFRAPRGVCDRELVELWFEIDVAAVEDFDAGALGTGTYSRFSTLAVRRSLYSSPTSPEYLSAIVASSHLCRC